MIMKQIISKMKNMLRKKNHKMIFKIYQMKIISKGKLKRESKFDFSYKFLEF